jgi:membrane fusion protein (multidrug efflux system)
MKKRQLIILGSVGAIVILSYLLMQFLIAQKEDLPVRPPEVNERWVKAEPANYSDIVSPVVDKGRVVSTAELEVVAEASGKIEAGDVVLKKGQRFRKGQVLLTIYRDEAELALKSQKSRFLNTIANLLPDVKVDYPDLYDNFMTFFNSIELEKVLPPMPDIKSEQMRIFLASRNVLAEYYDVKQAELKLARNSISAPFNGSYIEVFMEVGAYVNTGGRIAKIIATDALEVEVPVRNVDTRWIRPGDPVQLKSVDRDAKWTGTVTRISDFVDINTQSRSIFVHVPGTDQSHLYAREYLDAEFEGGSVPNVMEIPRGALFNHDQVFTISDGLLKIQQAEVIKLNDNENTALIRGIEPGVFVVTQPMINVAENTPVKILGVDKQD